MHRANFFNIFLGPTLLTGHYSTKVYGVINVNKSFISINYLFQWWLTKLTYRLENID